MKLQQIKTLIGKKTAELETAQQMAAAERQALTRIKCDINAILEAQNFLQELAQQVQQQAHTQIGQVVTRCLQAVFSEQRYELRIKFTKMRGRTDAELHYLKDGYTVRPETDSGGVQDVAGLALRLASLNLAVPQMDKVLILDEPFGGVSQTNLPRIADLILTLAKELGMQFIIVTHNEALNIGKVVQL
jgi:DNA repair exonuclease SbcCD ATPase subunit